MAGETERLGTAAEIRATDQVLDIGCGTGECTRIAARAASRGQVLGIDVSGPFVDTARALAAEGQLTNVEFMVADAQTNRFDAGRYDVAISRLGVMFFDEPHAAFVNIRSALRLGGRLAFVCHRNAPGPGRDMKATVAKFLPEAPAVATKYTKVDFTADAQLRELCEASGFTSVAIEPVEYVSQWGTELDETVDFILDCHLSFLTRNMADNKRREVKATVMEIFLPFHSVDGVRASIAEWVVSAQNASG